MTRIVAFVLQVLACAAALGSAQELPEPLAALHAARQALRTGQITWRVQCNAPAEDSGVQYFWYTPSGERYYSGVFTTGECAVQDLGDAQGVVWQMQEDSPDPELAYRPKHYLWWEDAQWEYRDGSVVVEAFPRYRSMPDPRGLGLTPDLASLANVLDQMCQGAGMSEYETRMDNGLCHVIARSRHADWEVHYVLDPERGWNPVRKTAKSGGRLVWEVRSTLKQYGEEWFPEKVEIYDGSFEGGQQPLYVVEVLSASFNQPDHPKKLTPASIGIEPGVTVLVYEDKAGRLGKYVMKGWDGKRCIDLEEQRRRHLAGEFRPGPRVQREIDRILAMGFDRESWRREWENYVRHFIERYKLNKEQAERAWRILRDCTERAERHMSGIDAELLQIRAAVRRELSPSSAHEGSSPKLVELKRRTLKLLAPMTRIFYGELVPRLDKIPTRAQREAVAQREQHKEAAAPATAPADQP